MKNKSLWGKETTIKNPIELWEAIYGWDSIHGKEKITLEESIERIKKSVYKYTDCGAWIGFQKHQIQIGSIVEGVEECTPTITLKYPFKMQSYWDALESTEKSAKEIWKRTHGCDDCGDPDPETGYIAINPKCIRCNGEGIII